MCSHQSNQNELSFKKERCSYYESIACYFRLNTTMSESVRDELKQAMEIFQEDIRPVWKKEFVSLYCFLPWLVYFRMG